VGLAAHSFVTLPTDLSVWQHYTYVELDYYVMDKPVRRRGIEGETRLWVSKPVTSPSKAEENPIKNKKQTRRF
jgi:hypothetical protein